MSSVDTSTAKRRRLYRVVSVYRAWLTKLALHPASRISPWLDWRLRGALQTVSFLAFLALLTSAVFFFWHRVLSDLGTATTATLFSLMLVAAMLALVYGLAEGRI